MISAFRSRAAIRRAALALSLAGVATLSLAARPAAPGVSYRVRMVVTPPDMPGMSMQPTVIVGHGVSIGTQSRLDIDSVSGQVPLAIGDYILSLDSGRTVTVSPSTKSYSEGLAGMAALPPEIMAQASVSNVSVTTEKLGPGETIQGFATEKVRMTISYSLFVMGTGINNMAVSELWLAQLPASVTTPFDGQMPKEMSQGPLKELADKVDAARKQFSTRTALRTMTTTSITGPMNVSTSTTVDLLDVKVGDVDAAMLKVPEGFAKKP